MSVERHDAHRLLPVKTPTWGWKTTVSRLLAGLLSASHITAGGLILETANAKYTLTVGRATRQSRTSTGIRRFCWEASTCIAIGSVPDRFFWMGILPCRIRATQ